MRTSRIPTSNLHKPVLVLNASYEPVNLCSVRRALTLLVKERAVVEVSSGELVKTHVRLRIERPSVIRLTNYNYVPRRTRVVSRKNIFQRDRYSCQYCHKVLGAGSLTLDHVIPRSRNGPSTWENLVTACYSCNNVKSSRTPAEAGMPVPPRHPSFGIHTNRNLMRQAAMDDPAWQKYLFFDSSAA